MADERYMNRPEPMRPIVLIGETLAIWLGTEWRYFTCHQLVAIPPGRAARQNFGAILAGQQLQAQQFIAIRPVNGEFVQYRFWPIDDIELVERQPQSSILRGLQNVTPTIDKMSIINNPFVSSTETYTYELGDQTFVPFFDVTNPTGYNLAQSVVAFTGFRFRIVEDTTIPIAAKQNISNYKGRAAFILGTAMPQGARIGS